MYTDKDPRLRELTDDDVLLGRGFPAIENEGNVRFRELVRSRSAEYHAAYRRHTKDSIARDVVNTINRRGGRFLTQLDDAANIKGLVIPAAARVWTEADEAAVLIKAKQALRDHSDESKEGGRSFSRRRPAAGSGNMVLEWIVPSPSQQRQQQQHQQAAAGGAMPTASSSSSHVAAPNTLQQFNASSIFPSPTTHHLWFLNPERVGSALNMAGHPGGGVAGGHDATGLFAATARQQQNMYLSAGQQQPEYTPANLQFALGQLLHNQTQQQQQQQTGGGISSIPAGFAGLLQNTAATTTAPGSLVSFQGMFASQQQQQQRPSPVATVSDQGLSSSQHALSSNSSISRTAPGAAPPQQTTARGTRSSAAIHRAIENAAGSTASAAPREGSIPLCDLEVKLLIVLCSFGLPTWTKESRESAFASTTDTSVTTSREEGSLPFGWSDVGKHLLTACQSSTTGDCGSATGTVTRLLTELDTLARMAIALVGRCVDCVQGGEGLTASLTQQSKSERGVFGAACPSSDRTRNWQCRHGVFARCKNTSPGQFLSFVIYVALNPVRYLMIRLALFV